MLTGQSVHADWTEAVQLTWRPYGDVAPADVAGDVADSGWLTVSELYGDTWHHFGRMVGCHVAQSRAATWHPFIGYWLLFGCSKF
jgi:hypothetical protein